MSAVIFSTSQYAKTLQAVGFTKEQSQALSEGIGYRMHTVQDLAIKNELYEVRDQLNQKIDEKFHYLDEKFNHLNDKFNYLNNKVSHLEEKIDCMADVLTSRLFNRLGGLMVACMSVGISALAYFTRSI
jgi:predicted nuclease with TOPRIM domain